MNYFLIAILNFIFIFFNLTAIFLFKLFFNILLIFF